MRLGHNVMPLQEGYSMLGATGRVFLLGIDTHYMHVVGTGQSERLEHVQGTRRVWAPIVGDNHRLPLGQCGRDSDDRARTLLHDHVERCIRFFLGFKVKKGVLPEHDKVIPLGLQKDLLSRETTILEELAGNICLGTAPRTVLQELLYLVVGVRQQGGIMVHFVGACPKRHRLRLADGWGIDNPQPDEHSARVLRPSNTKFHCGCTVCRTVQPN